MRSAREKVGIGLVAVGTLGMSVLGIFVYIWSLVTAYLAYGIGAAVVTGMVPIFAQCFWWWWLWHQTGVVFTNYGVCLLGLIASYGLMALGQWMMGD